MGHGDGAEIKAGDRHKEHVTAAQPLRKKAQDDEKRQRDDDCADGLIEPEMRAVEHAVEDEQDAVKDQIAVVDLLQLPVVEAEQKQERENAAKENRVQRWRSAEAEQHAENSDDCFENWQGFWDRCATMAAVSAAEKIAEDRHEIKRRDGLAAVETAGAIDLREIFLATLGEAGNKASQAGAEDEKEESCHWITSERVVI